MILWRPLIACAAFSALVGCDAALQVTETLAEDPLTAASEPDELIRRSGKHKPDYSKAQPPSTSPYDKLFNTPSPTPTPTPTPTPSPTPIPLACPDQPDAYTCFSTAQDGDYYMIYMQPNKHVDLTADIRWTLTGMTEVLNPRPQVLKPGSKTLVSKLKRTANYHTYNYTYNVTYGDHTVTQDSYVYGLPWRAGETYRCGNAWNGGGAHVGDYGYAADFLMPEGTSITAARDGVVFLTEDRFSQGGNNSSLGDKANFIYIRHDNGVYSRYLHLKQGGVKVKVGQKVKRGEVIGLSGNTGWSTAPHLHFDIMTAKAIGANKTLPVKLQVRADQPAGVQPTLNASYTAF